MASCHGPNGSAQVGFAQWCNFPLMSDITIKYGPDGDRVFHGHKMILAPSSFWFRKAFFGSFAESETKEIILREDDPETLKVMLEKCYDVSDDTFLEPFIDYYYLTAKEYEAAKSSNEVALFHLRLYEVLDKYDVPRHRERAQNRVVHALQVYINHIKSAFDEGSKGQFRDFIHAFYDLTSAKGPLDEFRERFADYFARTPIYRLVGDRGQLSHVVSELCREIPEFGQDIALAISRVTEPTTFCPTLMCQWMRCLKCRRPFGKEKNGTLGGYCPVCGEHMDKFIDETVEEVEERDVWESVISLIHIHHWQLKVILYRNRLERAHKGENGKTV